MWWLTIAASLAGSADRTEKTPTKGAPPAPHWTYEGEEGPAHWAELSPDFHACGDGHAQTPIDVNSRYAETVGLDDVLFHYHPVAGKVVNNGHTVQATLGAGNAIEVDGGYYELLQFHEHSPSEHRLDGKSFPLELHLVHSDATGHLAVVGVFVTPGPANPALEPFLAAMSPKVAAEKPLAAPYDPAALLPAHHDVYRYTGSLTTPPCTEGVRWIVMATPVTASEEQIERIRALYEHNARPIQALNGRMVLSDATP